MDHPPSVSVPRLDTERLRLREFRVADFEPWREARVTALIDAANVRSLRVAARLGMRHEAHVQLFGKPVGRYALAR